MVEVLVATVLIGVALLALANLFIQSTSATSSAAADTVAANLAQKQLELLKAKNYQYWASLTNNSSIAWQDNSESMPIVLNQVSYTIDTVATTSVIDNNLVQVTVTVQWTERGRNRSVQLTTFYSKIE